MNFLMLKNSRWVFLLISRSFELTSSSWGGHPTQQSPANRPKTTWFWPWFWPWLKMLAENMGREYLNTFWYFFWTTWPSWEFYFSISLLAALAAGPIFSFALPAGALTHLPWPWQKRLDVGVVKMSFLPLNCAKLCWHFLMAGCYSSSWQQKITYEPVIHHSLTRKDQKKHVHNPTSSCWRALAQRTLGIHLGANGLASFLLSFFREPQTHETPNPPIRRKQDPVAFSGSLPGWLSMLKSQATCESLLPAVLRFL